jgi:Methionine synthase I, cobalamin-binding domain
MNIPRELQTVHAEVAFRDLRIDMRELYLLMGYGDRVPDKLYLDMIDEMLDELADYCTPEYGYVIHSGGRVNHDGLQIAETKLHTGKIIATSLREADCFAVFVATMGKGFERWNRKNKLKNDMVRTFFADSLGSILAEACVVVMLERMEREMTSQGLLVSNSYSPGYCDWQLEEQRKLFSFLPDQCCGVMLTESCLMIPIKSVSGIIGIGEKIKKRLYSCDICTMTNCVKNRNKHAGSTICTNQTSIIE